MALYLVPWSVVYRGIYYNAWFGKADTPWDAEFSAFTQIMEYTQMVRVPARAMRIEPMVIGVEDALELDAEHMRTGGDIYVAVWHGQLKDYPFGAFMLVAHNTEEALELAQAKIGRDLTLKDQCVECRIIGACTVEYVPHKGARQ